MLPEHEIPQMLEELEAEDTAQETIAASKISRIAQPERMKVHLRQYAGEPYIDRAIEIAKTNPERIAFNSVWVTRKYYPDPVTDINTGNAVAQAEEVASVMKDAKESLGIEASPGFGLHPINWLDAYYWVRRAKALESFIVAGKFFGQEISLDIEGYGYVRDNVRYRTPPPKGEEHFAELIKVMSPVRHVLLKHRMKATIYPAGDRKFDDYTRAALALGANRFGGEYSFVFASKLKKGEPLDGEEIEFWREQLTNTDPQDRGVHFIPGFLTTNFERGIMDVNIMQNFMGVKECWLFVDDRSYLAA